MTNTIHPYNKNSEFYNFCFHPLHFKEDWVTKVSVITNIFATVFSFGFWLIPFWIVNRLDNRHLKVWKKREAPKVDMAASKTFSKNQLENNELHMEKKYKSKVRPVFTSGWDIFVGDHQIGELSKNGHIFIRSPRRMLEEGEDFGGEAEQSLSLIGSGISQPHGPLIMKSSIGTLNCQFDLGTIVGDGELTLSDGTVYKGRLDNGLFHGQGKLTLSSGIVYEGQWKNGILRKNAS